MSALTFMRVRRAGGAIRLAFSSARWQEWLLLALIFLCGLALRKSLLPYVSPDVIGFNRPWFLFLRENGFEGLGQNFANYNMPYLYLLYLGTLTHLEAIPVIKVIAGISDLVLAAGICAIVYHFRRNVFIAGIVGLGALFVPEVLLNSAMWGQADAIYTGLLVWTAYFLLIKRSELAWVCFALSFTFKLQGLFLLPWILVAFIVQKHRWRNIPIAVGVIVLTYIPALIAGRSVSSLMDIYGDQVSSNESLVANAANLYQLFPSYVAATVYPAGLWFGLGLVAVLACLHLRFARLMRPTKFWLLQVAAAYAALVPFVLPGMHDRYFYAAGVFTLISAFFDRRYFWPALTLQVTAVMAGGPALTGMGPAIPWGILCLVQMVAVSIIVLMSLGYLKRTPVRSTSPLAEQTVASHAPALASSDRL